MENTKDDTIVTLPSSSSSSSSLSLSSSFLSAEMLLNLDSGMISMKSGQLLKKDNGWLSFLFPFMFPRYKQRLCILVGNYFFKFKDINDNKPKGVPLPLDSITCSIQSEEGINAKESSVYYLILRTIRKTYTFKGANQQECFAWMKAIKDRKQIAIKESMGHIPLDNAVKQINIKCEKLFSDKLKREGGSVTSMNILDSTSTMNPMM